jgi:hypothetical protein
VSSKTEEPQPDVVDSTVAGDVTHQAERAEEPDPKPEPAPVQTPAPNTDVIDHLKSLAHSVLTTVDSHGQDSQKKLEFIERKIEDGFSRVTETIDEKVRLAVSETVRELLRQNGEPGQSKT